MKSKNLIEAIRNNVESSAAAAGAEPEFNIAQAVEEYGLATGYKNGQFVYKSKRYRVHVTLADDGSVTVEDVFMFTTPSWARVDKRQFTRRVMNVEQFKVK